MNDWIPLSESIYPEDDEVVIVTIDDGTVTIVTYVEDEFHYIGYGKIVAWMPLPSPYPIKED